MRTPEVEAAMAWAVLAYNGDTIGEAAAELLRSLATPDIDQFSDNTERQHDGALRTLAAEVERLEAGLVKANEAARAAMYAIDERAFLAECTEKSEKRAEAAEARVAMADQSIDELQAALNTQQARVAELEAQIAEVVGSQRNADKSLPTWAQVMNRVALLTEQNARLRALAFELASSLGACAGYIASVRTDRQITQDENVYALQTLEWAEGAVEVAQYANAALEAYDKALNGEEATHCADCDWTFPCWQTGAGCRKRPQGGEAST